MEEADADTRLMLTSGNTSTGRRAEEATSQGYTADSSEGDPSGASETQTGYENQTTKNNNNSMIRTWATMRLSSRRYVRVHPHKDFSDSLTGKWRRRIGLGGSSAI